MVRTVDEIIAETQSLIANIHHRPAMFVGSESQPGAADTLDGMMWLAHWFWATVQSRQMELRRVREVIANKHECGCQGFPETFRRLHPAQDEAAAFQFVRECWAEIDSLLVIDTSAAGDGLNPTAGPLGRRDCRRTRP